MQKVYSAVFGSGLGHVSRTYAIAKILQRELNLEVVYSSFDEGYDFLKSRNEIVYYSPSVEVAWNLAGGVSGRGTITQFPTALASFYRQVLFEKKRLCAHNPRVVLSDSRLSAVLAAKSLSYPVVTVLNQLRILLPPRFRGGIFAKAAERIEADILGLFWSMSDEILIPDLPPPFTISETNVLNVDTSKKMRFAGFMTPKPTVEKQTLDKIRSVLQIDTRPTVFIQISGPAPTKERFLRSALGTSESLSRNYNVIISKGMPSGTCVPRRLANGVWVYDWCPIKDEIFALCDVVVARAGHTTISQCVSTGKPSVVVPIFNHSEQIWNGEKFAKLGLGISIRAEKLSSSILEKAVRDCFNNSSYKRKAEELMLISDRLDGIQEAANTVRNFL